MSFFVLVFDRQTGEPRACERYEDMESAASRMSEPDTDSSTFAVIVEADDEQSLGEQVAEIGELALDQAMREAVATFPHPERRVLSLRLWGHDDTGLTRKEIASEIGCSVRTVKKLEKRGFAKLMDRLQWPTALRPGRHRVSSVRKSREGHRG